MPTPRGRDSSTIATDTPLSATLRRQRAAEQAAAQRALCGKLTRERDAARQRVTLLERDLTALHDRVALLERLDNVLVAPPAWVMPKRLPSAHHGILTVVLSDCHFDEVVLPAEVEGANAYNRAIAEQRLRCMFERIVMLARSYFAGVTYDGVTVLLGGDMLSGTIHEELVESNEDHIFASLDYWVDHLTAFLQGLATEFGRLHCAAVVGNHGRRTRKPRAKGRVRDNLDWLLYRTIAKATRGHATWQISEAADCDVSIYQTRYRLTHGDQFRGGTGIAGILSPISLGHHRKSRRAMSVGTPFDWLVMGHWHQYFHGRGLVVNGSLKGYDEYAYMNNFDFEPPQQAFWLSTPEHGPSLRAPIFPGDRKRESW